jgi:PKD repeat protein
MTNPLYSYPHAGNDAAVTGGFVYRGTQFPPSYQGVYFYGDFAQNWIKYLTLDASGNVTGSSNFLPADGSLNGPYDPVMLKQGPDGSLYYVDFGWGWQESSANPAAIRRIRYVAANQPPVAVVSATPRNGQAPLSVSFSSAGSFDPEGQPLTYSWTFGDGGTSTAPNPVHVYAQSGQYTAQLTLSDGNSTTLSDVLVIAVGSPPQGTITSPANGLIFRAGDVISFSGTATDPQDGTLPASAYSWTVLFHHDTHVHPTLGPVSGLRPHLHDPLTGQISPGIRSTRSFSPLPTRPACSTRARCSCCPTK